MVSKTVVHEFSPMHYNPLCDSTKFYLYFLLPVDIWVVSISFSNTNFPAMNTLIRISCYSSANVLGGSRCGITGS